MIACLLFKIYVQNLVLKTLFSLYYLYSYWAIAFSNFGTASFSCARITISG